MLRICGTLKGRHAVIRVADGDEAVARANASGYGLASAVYGKRHAGRLASAVKAGMTSINAVQMVAAVPALPFGGVGESGFGRIHGEEGLREFTWVKAITRQRFPLPFVLTSFQRPRSLIPMLKPVHAAAPRPRVTGRGWNASRRGG